MVNYAITQIKLDPTVSALDRNYVIDMLNSQKNNPEIDRKVVQNIMAEVQRVSAQAVVDLANEGKIDQKVANMFTRRIITTPNRNMKFMTRIKYIFKFQSRRFKVRKKVARTKRNARPNVQAKSRQEIHNEKHSNQSALSRIAMFWELWTPILDQNLKNDEKQWLLLIFYFAVPTVFRQDGERTDSRIRTQKEIRY